MPGSRSADADHPAMEGRACALYPASADSLVGWDLVHRDWGARQCERRHSGRAVRTRWRSLASAIASRLVHPLRGEPELLAPRTSCACGDSK
jgi:hypothetical protein